MQGITPCLWFNHNAEAALAFYADIFPDLRVIETVPGPDGGLLTAIFELAGQRLMALNGGPQFPLTEAISLLVSCDTQAEVDELWTKLTADGGEESMCGWLKDRFGLSWQIIPTRLMALLAGPDPARAQRATAAMLQMRKIDIAALERAASEG